MPALHGQPWVGRERVYAEQAGDVALTGAGLFTMIRDARYKAMHIAGSDEGQLFDLQADPGEMRNLWSDPAHASERRRLTDGLLQWRMESSLQTMDLMAEAR
jgi:arylsulfatase A-like enzyme